MTRPAVDYYALLGVAPGASAAAIRVAFRRLAKELHPDASQSAATTDRFRQIVEAYDVLSDPARRVVYDAAYWRSGRVDTRVAPPPPPNRPGAAPTGQTTRPRTPTAPPPTPRREVGPGRASRTGGADWRGDGGDGGGSVARPTSGGDWAVDGGADTMRRVRRGGAGGLRSVREVPAEVRLLSRAPGTRGAALQTVGTRNAPSSTMHASTTVSSGRACMHEPVVSVSQRSSMYLN